MQLDHDTSRPGQASPGPQPPAGFGIVPPEPNTEFMAIVGQWLIDAAVESDARRRRINELLEAQAAEVQRRRKFEAEANQEFAERVLLRGECIRLRAVLEVLANFIEERFPFDADDVPADVRQALESVFPGRHSFDVLRVTEEGREAA